MHPGFPWGQEVTLWWGSLVSFNLTPNYSPVWGLIIQVYPCYNVFHMTPPEGRACLPWQMLVIFSMSVLSCIHIVVFLKEPDRHHEAISHTTYWSAMFWWVCLLTLWLFLFSGFSFNSFVILNSLVQKISCWR